MKINYDRIKGCAVVVNNHYNLQELVLAFIYDGMLPITEDHIHSKDMELYKKWCFFAGRIGGYLKKYKDRFAIALEPRSLEGCVYGDASDLAKEGYEIISLTSALDELPNMCNILGVTPDEFLETHGLIESDNFSPHYITLDGLIRADNGGCLNIREVLDLLTKVGYITEEHNKLYDLFNLSAEDEFVIKGHMYEGFSSADNFKELIQACKRDSGLIYKLINEPNRIQKLEKSSERRV